MTTSKEIFEKGKDWVKLTVDSEVYSLSSIYAAGYVFLDKAYLYLDKDSKGAINVWLFQKNKNEDLDTLGKMFCNELLNYAHYFSNLKVNGEVVKMLMQRALFSAAPSLADDVRKKEIENLIGALEEKSEKKKVIKKKQ